MLNAAKIFSAAGVVLLLMIFVVALLVKVPYVSTEQLLRNRTIGEITGDKEVGQIFESVRPNLEAVGFQIATYGARENNKDVIFELRSGVEDEEALRKVVVNASEFSDHQIHEFWFEPIPDSAGKTYYASLRSPESVAGNAITIDYENSNVYKKGASSLVVISKERKDSSAFSGVIKPNADATFSVVHKVSFLSYARLVGTKYVNNFVTSLKNDPGSFVLPGRFVLISLLLIVGIFYFYGNSEKILENRKYFLALVVFLVIVGYGFRLIYANQVPFTNDEGAYLYDARTVLEGQLPGGDALAKAPIFILATSLFIAIFGHILMAGRFVSILFGLLTSLPLYVLGKKFGGKQTGLITVMLWLLTAAPALFNSYGHTQTVQMFFGTLALAILVLAQHRKKLIWFFGAGIVLGVSIVARKSSLALGLPILFLFIIDRVVWKEKIWQILVMGAGTLLILGVFLASILGFYGATGVSYATGISLAKTSIEQLSDRGDLYATYSVRGILPFFREAIPLIFLAFVMLGAYLEKLLTRYGILASRLVWLLPIFLAFQGYKFIENFEEQSRFSYGVGLFWLLMPYMLAVFAIFPWRRNLLQDFKFNLKAITPFVWFVAVVLFYAFWIKFSANYISEFLPALVLVAGLGVFWLIKNCVHNKWLAALAVIILLWSNYSSAQSSYQYEHTGTFHWSSIIEAADYLKKNVPLTDLVQTGAVIIPYVSGHHVPFNVAHPTWYAYGYIEPPLRNVFMETKEKMVEEFLKNVKWFVREQLTEFSYFREYPMIENAVNNDFVSVKEIENLSNTITIYKRK